MGSVLRRHLLLATLALVGAGAAPAMASGRFHVPASPTGCTAVSTGAVVRCTFVVSSFSWGQEAEVIGTPAWTLSVLRKGHMYRVPVSTYGCFGYSPLTDDAAYMCGLPVRRGDHVTITVRSTGVIRAGDDVCAEDPLCVRP